MYDASYDKNLKNENQFSTFILFLLTKMASCKPAQYILFSLLQVIASINPMCGVSPSTRAFLPKAVKHSTNGPFNLSSTR